MMRSLRACALIFLATSVVARHGDDEKANTTCSRVVRLGAFIEAAPCAVALTGWLDKNGTCWAFYRAPTGLDSMIHLESGALDMAFIGSTPFALAAARGGNAKAVAVSSVNVESEGLAVRESVKTLGDLRGKILATPEGSTAHSILLATLEAGGLDGQGGPLGELGGLDSGDQVTVARAAACVFPRRASDRSLRYLRPQQIVEAWDAGLLDGASCWGRCLAHITSAPRGGVNSGGSPAHVLVDAGTTARWGYGTETLLAAGDAFLEAEPALAARIVDSCARANRDYVDRRGEDDGPWDEGGEYADVVDRFAQIEAWDYDPGDAYADPIDVTDEMRKHRYLSIERQIKILERTDETFDLAASLRRQAEFLFLWKVLADDPRELPAGHFAKSLDSALLRASENEAVPLDQPPNPLPTGDISVVVQVPTKTPCAAVTRLDVAAEATFDDGSRGVEGYYPSARCVWALASPTGCASVDVEFLASKPPYDRLDVFSSTGLLLARFHGREGLGSTRAKRPRVVGCSEASNSTFVPDDWVPAEGPAALYVRWTTNDFDERVIGALKPVGFSARARPVDGAAEACPPGLSGPQCRHRACSGILISNATNGVARAAPPGLSPSNEPQEYEAYAQCGWWIKSTEKIVLDVTQMDVERVFDYVDVYAGGPPYDRGWRADDFLYGLLRPPNYDHKVTGYALPAGPFVVDGDAFVSFRSDGIESRPGFELQWSTLAGAVCPALACVHGACRDGVCVCESGYYGATCAFDACEGTVRLGTMPAGRITSGVAEDYPPARRCVWKSRGPRDADGLPPVGLTLRFSRFALEAAEVKSTTYDAMKVYLVDYEAEYDLDGAYLLFEFCALSDEALSDESNAAGAYHDRDGRLVGTFELGEEVTLNLVRGTDATGVAIVFDSDENNPEARSGFDMEYAVAWQGEDFCDGGESWPCPAGFACEQFKCVRDDDGKAQKALQNLRVAAIVVGGTLCFLLLVAGLVLVLRFVNKKQALEAERAAVVRDQVEAARAQIGTFLSPFCCLPGDEFLRVGRLAPHEELRDAGTLRFFDTVDEVEAAKKKGVLFVFLSHQWLGFDTPDPNGVHFASARQALRDIAQAEKAPLERLRVWIDYSSIPQANCATQKLAVSSLPAFASVAEYFVVIAPDATHRGLRLECNSRSYRRRAWCRAEIMSCWARRGPEKMFASTNDGLRPLFRADDRALLLEAVDVFAGELTCCRLGHPGATPCDREHLMLPLLGLFYEIYRDRESRTKAAWEVVGPLTDRFYPRRFVWRHGEEAETAPLFGDLIDAAIAAADLEMDHSKTGRLQPLAGFAAGTQANRAAYRPKERPSPFIALSRSVSRISAVTASARPSSATISEHSPGDIEESRSLERQSTWSSPPPAAGLRGLNPSLPLESSPDDVTPGPRL